MGAIYGFTGAANKQFEHRMASALAHRGSYPSIICEQQQCTLSYIPCHNEDTRKRTGSGLFHDNGQVIALAGCLTGNSVGEPVLPQLLEKYREKGLEFSTELRGAFVLAIKDGDAIHLIRDGAGVRTVYYGQHGGRFYFASEPKSVLAVPGFPRKIRPGAVAQYLSFSFIPGSRTMLEGLYELPAGHWITCNGGSEPKVHRFFRFEQEIKDDIRDDAYWIDTFRDTLSRAVEERLPGQEPLGITLSGGIDSSVVAAEVVRQYGKTPKTYAIHFGKNYPNELEFARAVAERLKTDHEEVLIRPKKFLPNMRKIIWHLDDPIGDPVTMPNFEIASHISKDVRWVFNGEGGDPLFGGPKNLSMLLHHWYGGIRRDANFRESRYLSSYRRGYEELEPLLTPEWRKQYDAKEELEAVLTPFFDCNEPADFLDKLMAINIRLKGAHLILPKVERMTSAWKLTHFAPLFDERLIRLSFRMPSTMKLAGGIEKIILKKAYRDALPREIIERPKSGMRVPVHFWFQGEMKRYAKKLLKPKTIREVGIFNPERVKQLLDYNTSEGPGRYGLRLWMLITFEIWRRIVIEGEPV